MTQPRIGAVILAAGFGTRLSPLTDHTPKPLLDVGSRPVVSHLVERLREVAEGGIAVAEIMVVVNDRHLDQWQRWQGMQLAEPPINIVSNGVARSAERAGAVADLRLGITALKQLSTTPTFDWIVVLAGDNLIDEPIGPFVEAALRDQYPVVLCRDLGSNVPPGRFGEVTIGANQQIIRFREKPNDPASPLAATCTYVLPGDIHRELEVYLSAGDADSPGSFIGWLANRTAVGVRVLTGRYFDIGDLETLAHARAAMGS